jgi:hypothetical protein
MLSSWSKNSSRCWEKSPQRPSTDLFSSLLTYYHHSKWQATSQYPPATSPPPPAAAASRCPSRTDNPEDPSLGSSRPRFGLPDFLSDSPSTVPVLPAPSSPLLSSFSLALAVTFGFPVTYNSVLVAGLEWVLWIIAFVVRSVCLAFATKPSCVKEISCLL